ncbi:MAG: hypothetical protein H0W62_04110 [Chitinophagales bacterium]|nr:hypothetical protein [Chitinophagales bacterium]
MSKAFVKESDDEWLNEIQPTMNALINFLTRENNGIKIFEKKIYVHPGTKKEIHEMSNGLSYSINDDERWYVID